MPDQFPELCGWYVASRLCFIIIHAHSPSEFRLWAPPEPDSDIADNEGETVAWSTKPDRGTRVIPAGALINVQFLKSPDYVQVVGLVDQSELNMQKDNFEAEMDPHSTSEFHSDPYSFC